ncbi:MAG: serine/threonine protein kinase [bacterium]|nr:serine/threonine protein kinase [bacterium]
MTPERWQRIKDLFEQAAELQDDERAAFLSRECGGDADLRVEVEALIKSDEQDGTLLDTPVADVLEGILAAEAATPAAGRRFGPYRVEREIGRGGMAVIYTAVRDDDQYRKQVAIKLIKRGMDTDAMVARFRRERQILANLEHPSIARLLDGGVSDDGLPYLVMEHIEGLPIDAYCDRYGLSTDERLRLFRTVCAAVHFAHRNLVVHRDLKPSNILVTEAGEPKLLDFGIAKLLTPDPGETQPATVAGVQPMTPEYASPEQVRGEPITTASDVYALGVLLYQLLTGRRPFRFGSRSPREIESVICKREPEKPSTVIALDPPALDLEAEAEPPASAPSDRAPAKLRRKLRGDLDNIVLKALKKEPERRYGSVEQLSEDLRRHLEGLPVIARADTFGYRTAKFVGRHAWGVAAALLIFLSLVAGIFATAWQARIARAERATSEEVSDFLVDLFETSRPDKALGETITARELLDRGAERIERELGDEPAVRARLMDSIGLAYSKLGLYDRAAGLLSEAVDLRRRTAGGEHPSVAVSMNHLGVVHTAQGRYPEAEQLLEDALALRREELGQEHELVAESLNDLGVLKYYRELYDQAEILLRQALELRREVHGAEHSEVAYVLNNLALVLYARDRYEEAEALSGEALAMHRKLLGDRHPDVAVTLNNLAEVLRAQESCQQAIGLFRQALELEIGLLGEEHPDVAITQSNLAGCLKDEGELDEAEELYRRSLELIRGTAGEHPQLAGSLNNLAGIFVARGDHAQAEAFFREALAVNREIHGGDHPDVAKNLSNLAITLERTGDHAAAEQCFREALEINGRLLGDEDPAVLANRKRLSEFLLRRGDLGAAEAEFRQLVALERQTLESPHRDLARSLLGLSRVLLAAGRPGEAEPAFRESLEMWRQWPDEWLMRAGTQSLLGGCLTELERYAESEPLLVESHAAFEEKRTASHPSTKRAVGRLIGLYEAWGRPEEAARYRARLAE